MELRLAPATATVDPAAWAPTGDPVGDTAECGLQAATLHAAARPATVAVADAARPADAACSGADSAHGFAPRAEPLVPVTLIGLQVQPGDAWSMACTGRDAGPVPPPEDEVPGGRRGRGASPDASEDPALRAADNAADNAADPTADHAGDRDAEPPPDPGPYDDAPDAMRRFEALARALNALLAAPRPPAALLTAADQWTRGRCVVLVCPRAAARGPAGDAFVLRTRRAARGSGPVRQRFVFSAVRFEARIAWAQAPAQSDWCLVRTVKEHHPRSGRQLVSLDVAGTPLGAVPCEVQLGPVRARPPRWRDASVRIDALRSFWTALGGQWSAWVLVCSQPLAGGCEPHALES